MLDDKRRRFIYLRTSVGGAAREAAILVVSARFLDPDAFPEAAQRAVRAFQGALASNMSIPLLGRHYSLIRGFCAELVSVFVCIYVAFTFDDRTALYVSCFSLPGEHEKTHALTNAGRG